jgi:membrane protein DedA with SNARE-associated domain
METLNELLTRLSELIDSLAAFVTDSPLTYLVIFALAAVDPLFPILPAEAVITAAAVLAGQGQLSLGAIMLAAGLGAFLGDNIVYWVGRSAGRPLVQRVLRGRADRLEAVESQFHERGGIFIVIGRFIPGGRTAVSAIAGILHFSWPRFLAYDALAALVWAIQAALPGYIGGVIVSDRPWLAMLLGFGLSIALGGTLALAQRWWAGRRTTDREVQPAAGPDVLAAAAIAESLGGPSREPAAQPGVHAPEDYEAGDEGPMRTVGDPEPTSATRPERG